MSNNDRPPNSQNILVQECLSRFKERLQYALNNNPLDLEYLEYIVTQERTFLSALDNTDLPAGVFDAIEELNSLLDQQNAPPSFHSVEMAAGPHGRLRLNITEAHLHSLLKIGLPVSCLADILGVSRRTMHRRMQEYNMSVRSQYSTITDDVLDERIGDIKSRFPHAGYSMVRGCLQAEGHRVQWSRVKASMHRVDAEGILSRLSAIGCVVRRKYSVQGPHFLQHVDTNHKLVRYNIVIFGGIDGFSRKIMFLDAASNNTASTAASFFLDGVRQFGWPYKVRADQGVENVEIAQMMFTMRGTGCGSFISGKSVHNQRIERLWRDVWTVVTHVYYDVLHSLEEDGSLNISDSLHLFCAQHTFLPRLKVDLAKFSAGWNEHPISSERGLSPNQLWELGMLQRPVRQPEISEENVAEIQIEDIDWESAGPSHHTTPGVIVPEMECPLNAEDMESLRLAVNPLAASSTFGRDIYLTTLSHALYLLHHH